MKAHRRSELVKRSVRRMAWHAWLVEAALISPDRAAAAAAAAVESQ